MYKRLFMVSGAALMAAAILTTFSCSRSEGIEKRALDPELLDRRVVPVAKAALHDLAHTMVLTAEFRPYQEIDVMAKVAGYVKQINVDIGDRVQQGQQLATLEVPEMADDLAKAAASLQRNTAELARAQQDLMRAQSAHQIAHLTFTRLADVMKGRPGLIAQQEVDDAQSRDLVSEAQVAAAKSALEAAREQIKVSQAEQGRTRTLFNYTHISAPFTGVITKRYADTGSMIQAGTASQTQAMPLVRLSQNSLLRLVLPVPEAQVPRIHVGEQVEVRVPSLHRSFPGKVVRFANQLQLSTRTMDTEVDVRNADYLLMPGMYAEVNLVLDQRPHALAVPVTAVSSADSGSTIMLVTPEGVLEDRAVSTGLETADRVEIRSGLAAGDLVVIGNRSQLKPGEHVIPKVVEFAALQKEQ